MKRNIHLYGYLAEKYGKIHTLAVESIGEAVRAMKANYPDFYDSLRQGEFAIFRGEDVDNGEPIEFDDQLIMIYKKGDFHIVPVVEGSGPWVRIVIGVVLVAAGVYFQQPWLVGIGMSLIIGGVIELLTPVPSIEGLEREERADERRSFIFTGATNQVEEGGPVPVVYGRMWVGSTTISAGVDVEDVIA